MGVGDDNGVEAGLKFSKSLPVFVELGVARVVDPAEVEDIAFFLFGSLHSRPSEQGRSVESVALAIGKGGVVGGDVIMVEDEEGSDKS